ncbi:MAG: sulfatase [Planctomycetes bacterium]|nr:sulfatase [Planctomycetota bacterium]
MHHRDLDGPRALLGAALAACAALSAQQTPDATAPDAGGGRDHVLLIAIDDLNDWVGCMSDPATPGQEGPRVIGRGHPQASTPNMDRLAQRGVLFTNAHCQAPLCNPSRNSFLSGLRPTTSGIYGNLARYDAAGPLRPGQDVPWLTRRFEAAGYVVYTAGKLLHQSRNGPLGGTPCFETTQGPYPPNKLGVPASVTPASIWDIGAYPESEAEYTDLRIAKWTAEQIARPLEADGRPRFLALGFYNPHLPLFAPQKWFDAAPSKADVVLGASREDDLDDLPAIARRMGSRVAYQRCFQWCLDDEQNLRALTQAYLACTSAMDDALGHVLDALDASDLADDTWIVVLSDHGWHLGEKEHIAKQTLWSRSTHVPLVIVPPRHIADTPRGVRCDRPVELVDVYPTLVAAAGLAPADTDDKLDGISLLPWLATPDAARDRPAITTIYSHNNSVCDDRYRYIRYADGSEELYDRRVDPHEFDNLIERAKSDAALQEVVRRLAAWIPANQPGPPDLVDDRVDK